MWLSSAPSRHKPLFTLWTYSVRPPALPARQGVTVCSSRRCIVVKVLLHPRQIPPSPLSAESCAFSRGTLGQMHCCTRTALVLLQVPRCGKGLAAQVKGRSPECRVMCLFKWDFRTNYLLHTDLCATWCAPLGGALQCRSCCTADRWRAGVVGGAADAGLGSGIVSN